MYGDVTGDLKDLLSEKLKGPINWTTNYSHNDAAILVESRVYRAGWLATEDTVDYIWKMVHWSTQ
jgi:hypothetical protein